MQDPYSLRCQPQVMGACLDQLRHAALCSIEANAVTDNPLVFAGDDGRRCSRAATSTPSPSHSPPTRWRMAIAEIGALSERRIALLIDADVSRPAAVPVASLASTPAS